VTAVTFPRLDGQALRPDPVEGARMMAGLATGSVSEAGFAGWLSDGMRGIDRPSRQPPWRGV